jgi:alginate O-acetyltransferase complex protein AlgI
VFLFGFLPVVFALFWLARSKRSRYVLLALSGYVFYGYWNWRFCGLLLFSSLTSFTAGLLISRSADPRFRHRIVVAAVAIDLSLLGFFKYYDFLARSVGSLLSGSHLPILDIVLPIGISFYTFHTISYVVDVSAGRVRATSDLWEYLTYVNLFSQLVAGPIVRFRQIEQDLEHIDGPPRVEWMARGIGFFMVGLAKKVMIADHIASGIDPVLLQYGSMSFAAAWVAALGYTIQLYFDFSGYSDMAVGLGYLFGLRIPQNFNAPYRAAGITDFWRRWHISLSSFLRDYLYVPLGGNRRGALRTKINLMIVMLLGGLWHGANWTFVAWGGYHGLLLIIDRAGERFFHQLPRHVYQLGTFFAVLVGWVLFRSASFGMAWAWLGKLITPGGGMDPSLARPLLWTMVGLAWAWLLPETWDWKFSSRPRMAVAWATAFVCIYFFMNGTESVFLYYQF